MRPKNKSEEQIAEMPGDTTVLDQENDTIIKQVSLDKCIRYSGYCLVY